mgnify:CR=1 FL=1|tara:strand:+ start:427 stop:798 length:372 start_codon:yes stop_codon:yes gene_type:complete
MTRSESAKINPYFEEKSFQVEIDGRMSSFGITISSFYTKAWEIVEMLNFTIAVARLDLHKYVESVHYYSKSNVCTFVFSDDLEVYSHEAFQIQDCARQTIAQFEMFGCLDHGKTVPYDMLYRL